MQHYKSVLLTHLFVVFFFLLFCLFNMYLCYIVETSKGSQRLVIQYWVGNIHDKASHALKVILMKCYISGSGFDSGSHVIASSDILNPRDGHPIRYYLWPTLLSRRHGDVLNKGRVILKADG